MWFSAPLCTASYNGQMAQTYDICIRGAGIVGRTLALHLAAKRLRVALVAAPTTGNAHEPDVRAYALSPASRALLESVRCWPDTQHATPVVAMQVVGETIHTRARKLSSTTFEKLA